MDEFILFALLAGIGLALVSGPLGCVVIWRRMAYFGDTLAHAALLGVALAVSFDVFPVAGVMLVGISISIILFWLEKNRDFSTDTLLGVLSHSALAMGLIVLALFQNKTTGVNLMTFLFGDILAINYVELMSIYLGAVIIFGILVSLWRNLILISINEEIAVTDGVNVQVTKFIFMLLLALVIAIAMKVVGILLITALLIIPAAAARTYSKTPTTMAIYSIVFGVFAVVFGLGASIQWDIPTGPSIVVVSAISFFLVRITTLSTR